MVKTEKLLYSSDLSEVSLVEENGKKYIAKMMKITKDVRVEQQIISYLSREKDSDIYIQMYIGEKITNNKYQLLLAYLEGPTLYEYKYKKQDILLIMYQTLKALNFIHKNEVIHGDIKLENIIKDRDTFKFIDFGFSCFFDDQLCLLRKRGTLDYLSPEFPNKDDILNVKIKSDIWALGIVFYECYFGKLPFHGETLSEQIRKVRNDEPYFSNTIPKTEDYYIQKIIKDMLIKDYERRPDTTNILNYFEEKFEILSPQ